MTEVNQSSCGLMSKGKPVPLLGVRVDAELRDLCSRVTLAQRYRNDESNPIEAVYIFPLDEAAAVCGFEVLVGETLVVGEVQERDQAFEAYDDALAEGHGAYLLDQEKPDVFTASVGNVLPGQEVLVRIFYVTELSLEGDEIRFVLPTTVSPRYAPAEDQKGVGRPPADAVSPPIAWKVPYGLELEVRLEMPSAIRAVTSPSHPISVEIDSNQAKVGLGERQSRMDSDFVLLVKLAEPQMPRGWLEKKGAETVAMVAFQPSFEAKQAPCEAVFLIDRSGSMQGSSIAEARNALQLCLRSLSPGSTFNVVGFGSTFDMLFPESRPYDDTSLAEASRHVERLDADMGGTEILPALEAVLTRKSPGELPRQLFVLTDGQVSNTEAVIALVRRHSDTTRVFTFGIGAGASHHLLKGLARAGEGAAEMIAPGERIEAKVMRQLRKALAPALTDVRVDWGDLDVDQAPHRVPPVFAGGRVLVYGLFREGATRPPEDFEVRLRAKRIGGELSFAVPLRVVEDRGDAVVLPLAAKAFLRDLEEGASSLHDRTGSLQERSSKDRVKQEAVRIGVKYSLASRWTSFVAIEKRESKGEGGLELRRVPAALTRGWGGSDFVRAAGAAAPRAMAMASPAFSAKEITGAFSLAAIRASVSSERPLDRLVRIQGADGSWELSSELADILGRKKKRLEKALKKGTGDRDTLARAWATALAIVWLSTAAYEWKDEWELLDRKAQAFLEEATRSGAKLPGGEDWLEAARRELT